MKTPAFLSGGGEMGELTRAYDWSTTSLGPAGRWPQSLRTTLATVLRSKLPMFLWWGPELLSFYNDAFRPSLGNDGKHPSILGRPARETWPEIWEMIYPQIKHVLETGEGTWNEDILMPIFRNGVIEDVYWTFGYSPVITEEGKVGGILVTGIETTPAVKARQLLQDKARQLEIVIDSADLGSWDTDLVTGRRIFNRRLKEFFGFAIDEEPSQEAFLGRLRETDQQRLRTLMTESMKAGSGGEFDMEYTIVIPGSPVARDVRAKGKTMFDDQGVPIRFTGTLQDVTQKNAALKALESSQREMVELFAEAPVAFTTISGDDDLRFTSANRFYGELVGRSPDDLIGKPLLEALPELTGQGFDELLKAVIATGVPYTAYEVPVQLARNKALETVFINFSYIPRWNADRKVTGILVTASDVSFQVRTRQAIEEKESLFRTLIEAAPFPIGVYMGENLTILHANPAIIEVYGKGPDVIGKGYLQLLPELELQGIGAQIRQVFASGRPYHSSTSRVDIDVNGSTRTYYFKYSFSPLFDPSGKVIGVLNTGVDVTEVELARQRAEEAEVTLRSAVELAELADWSIDIPGRTISQSPRLKDWTGLRSNVIPLDEFFDCIPEVGRQQRIQGYEQEFLSSPDSAFDIEHPIRHVETGHTRFIHIRGQLMPDAEGTPIRLTGTMQDITAQRAIQWELERQVAERTTELAALNEALQATNLELYRRNAELKYSNDELTQYAYITSHDLQEPLRKIRFFVSALFDKFDLPAESQPILQKITKSATRMTQLIQDLLAFSRLIGNNEHFQPVNLAAIIGNVAEDFELALQEKNGVLRTNSMPTVNGVSLHLNQLFHNLVGNALKFSAPGRSPEIMISSRLLAREEVAVHFPQSGHSRYLEITVADNGIGFESQFGDHIFELFKQLHSRDVYPGSGIGLALCRRIVNNHGGKIYAESVLGQGSTFYILLPTSGE